MNSLLQILKVNEQRSGVKDGRAWAMQDAECILLDDQGQAQQVGVLRLPKALTGDAAPLPGIYLGSFALQVGLRDRQIGAALVALQPYQVSKQPVQRAASAPSAG